MKSDRVKILFCICAVLLVWSFGAYAAELKENTIISKDNLDQVMNDTFEGHTIKSMLTDAVLMQIRDWNLKIRLAHSQDMKIDPRYIEATEKYSKNVVFDSAKRELTGWSAGIPFPNVSMDDPDAGDKLCYNYYYAPLNGNIQYVPHSWLLIDSKSGLERVQDWFWLRYYLKGKLGPNPVEGDGKTLTRTLFFITYPFDLKGVGLFTVRWDDPKLEDTWVYVKSVRRTRRLSGGAWIDPVGGLDMLNDDIWILNARPSWYKQMKLLGKRRILAVAHDKINWNKAKKGTPEEFPSVDLKNAPYWNPSTIIGWEPREVYVIECVPPDRHPYSKRVVYMDTKYPVLYNGDCYDKRGNFWKYINYTISYAKGKDGNWFSPTPIGFYLDFKQMHGSIHYCRDWVSGDTKITSKDVTLGKLRQAGR